MQLTIPDLACLMAICGFLERATEGTWTLAEDRPADGPEPSEPFRLTNGRDSAAVAIMRPGAERPAAAARDAVAVFQGRRWGIIQILALDLTSSPDDNTLHSLGARAAAGEGIGPVDFVLTVDGGAVHRIWARR